MTTYTTNSTIHLQYKIKFLIQRFTTTKEILKPKFNLGSFENRAPQTTPTLTNLT